MTKYILNSGGAKNYPDKAKKFVEEIVKGLSDRPHILFCFFLSQGKIGKKNLLNTPKVTVN